MCRMQDMDASGRTRTRSCFIALPPFLDVFFLSSFLLTHTPFVNSLPVPQALLIHFVFFLLTSSFFAASDPIDTTIL